MITKSTAITTTRAGLVSSSVRRAATGRLVGGARSPARPLICRPVHVRCNVRRADGAGWAWAVIDRYLANTPAAALSDSYSRIAVRV